MSLTEEQKDEIRNIRVPTAKTSREILLEIAVFRLLALKDYKEKYGKTEYYLSEQPKAWEQARKAYYS